MKLCDVSNLNYLSNIEKYIAVYTFNAYVHVSNDIYATLVYSNTSKKYCLNTSHVGTSLNAYWACRVKMCR